MKKTTSLKKKNVTTTKPKRADVRGMSFALKQRRMINAFLARRPHRSFRRTKRRDYVRSLKMPGYFAFTAEVFSILKRYKNTFLLLIISFSLASIVFTGLASQETYRQLSSTLDDTSQSIFTGAWGEIGKASLLLATSVNGTIRTDMTEVQQVYAFLLVLFTWLTTVWFLRTAGASKRAPKLRTAVYSAGAPIISTLLVAITLLLQLIPAAIGVIVYVTALNTDFLSNPLISIIFFFAVIGLILLSTYLIISSFFALIVVTLPGMYPWRAIRTAGDMVVGRRVRVLLRVLWMLVVLAAIVLVVMIPVIILINWLQSNITQIAQLPIIPILIVLVSTASTVFISAYVYLFYRKVLDDDAAPA